MTIDDYLNSLDESRAGVKSVGIEIEERFCEMSAKRLSQSVLNFEEAA